MKFCRQCGKSLSDQAAFCSGCGTRINSMPGQDAPPQKQHFHPHGQQFPPDWSIPPQGQRFPPDQNTPPWSRQIPFDQTAPPPKKSHKGVIIAVVCLLSVLLLCGLSVGGYLFYVNQKTNTFKKYVKAYQEKASSYVSLSDCTEEYEENLAAAKRLISNKDFQKMSKQKKQMEELWPQVEENLDKITTQKELFDDIISEMEDSEKYFFDDKEDDYQKAKNAAQTAIEQYQAENAVKKTAEFQEVAEDVKKYNEEEVKSYIEAVNRSTLGSGWMTLETSLLEEQKKHVDDYYQEKNFVKTKEAYEAFMTQEESLEAVKNANHVLSGYSQADVSKDYEVRLYFDVAEITNWKNNGFTIYEKAQSDNDWKSCKLLKVQEVEGNMTIDLVADVSSSMSSAFLTMQTILSGFASSTSADTYLGLSLIGNVYERKLNFTQDKNAICNGINNLTCNGLTSLYQSLYSSVMYTATASGAKCVVAFTDGKNVSYQTGYDYTADDVIRVAKAYQIPVYIIGLGSDPDSFLLRRIASETGGEYYDHVSITDMGNIYNTIYSQQKNRYEVTYQSALVSNADRQIYMLYYDEQSNVGIRFENSLEASTLYNGYQMTFDSSNLTAYYTDQKYISSDDLSHISNINDLQKVINIYCAKNGYQFRNANILQEMISLGVISTNGNLDMDATTNNLKQNAIIWANYMALYNHRYEMVYQEVYKVYTQNGRNMSIEQLMPIVHQNLGQTDMTRFSNDVTTAYKAITS